MSATNRIDWFARAERVGQVLRERADALDLNGRFAADNYRDLAEAGLLSAAVPQELGGGGATHSELCRVLRTLGRYCGSTALALSMHQHLVAATVWRHQNGLPGEALLKRVASEQLVLVSTGAGDWLQSHGQVERVEGGYRVSATKRFASGSPLGDILITSAPYEDPKDGWSVLHFSVPMSAPGVRLEEDWDSLGMRATGSHSVKLQDVFMTEQAVSLKRPRAGWHPVWSVVLTVAVPLYMAPYLGLADRAAEIAKTELKRRSQGATSSTVLLSHISLGEMENALLVAELAHREAIANANEYGFSPTIERSNRALQSKTLISNSVTQAIDKAMEAVGGASYFRSLGLERLWRDARASTFHPLPEKLQYEISGRLALGIAPVA